jgi:predicted phage terminase large subunit-like protein
VTTTRGKDWVYNIIKDQGLTHIFDKELSEVENDYIKVIRTTLYDSPWATDEQIKEQESQFTSSFARQELRALIVEGEGELIKPEWFKIAQLSTPTTGIRFWDLAVTTNTTSDFSCGCLMSINDGKYYINNMKRVKLAYPDLKKLITKTALQDGPSIFIGIEVSGQQRAILDDLRRERILANYTFKAFRPTKDKVTRAYPVASQIELGNVILNDEPWVRELKDECSTFSADNINKGSFKDDMIDSMTGAYSLLQQRAIVGFTKLPI